MSRLLVVEDDPVSLKLICIPLQALGHSITTAQNGLEAIDVLSKDSPFDLVITNLVMPKLDGYGLVKCIREQLKDAQLPLIIVSAAQHTSRLSDILHDTQTAYIGKPIDFMQLSALVGRMTNCRTTEFVNIKSCQK